MKTIKLMLLLVLFPISILAQGGGGDADGGGGPDNTITMLSANGMDKGIHKDLISSMTKNQFSNELLKNSGFNSFWMDSKFKGVDFHKNGSFTFQFEKKKKSNGPLPIGISKEDLDKSIAAYIQRSAQAKKERMHYIKMRDKYGEEALIETLDEVISATGAQVQLDTSGYVKIKELNDLQRGDIQDFLEKGILNRNLQHLTPDWIDRRLLDTPTRTNLLKEVNATFEFNSDQFNLSTPVKPKLLNLGNGRSFSHDNLFERSFNGFSQ